MEYMRIQNNIVHYIYRWNILFLHKYYLRFALRFLLKLSKILNFESVFNLPFNHPVICQSPLVHLDNLFIKLAYLVGYPSISIISVPNPHHNHLVTA